MEPRFADLHCHPHMRSFNWLHNQRKPEEKSRFHPWWIILSDIKQKKKGSRAAAYSQCDLVRTTNGNLKLAFLALYPLEKGWVTGRKDSSIPIAKNLKKYLGETIANEIASSRLNKIIRFIGNDKKGELAIRDFVQSIFMKIPLRRINHVQSSRYNYFKELKEEKKFLDKRNNKESSSKLYIPFLKKIFINKKKLLAENKNELVARGIFVLAENGNHVNEIIGEGKTAFVLTIEGANVFNTADEFEQIKPRIDEIKAWKESVFFITFTHHFNNFLAGHAHSIPDVGNLVLDQSEGLKSGFTVKGLKVIRHLLSLDETNQFKPDEFGSRILIDVKHLNAISRKEYYNNFVLPLLESEHPIPVVASHVAYSGKESLEQLIEGMDDEKDNDFTMKNGHRFNNWNINLCDEDVIIIYKSKGLIGINLDQRVLGVAKEDMNNNETHANYVWQNIKAMMKVVIQSNDLGIVSKKEITDIFCLGTDFDGFIDPLNKYPTALEFKQLWIDLKNVIESDNDKKMLLGEMDVEVFVNRICFDNAFDFVVKNFN